MDTLAELQALDSHRVLTPGTDPLWDRVFSVRPDVARIELDPEDYPTVYFVPADPAEPDDPFPTPALRGALKELVLSCWEEEGERRNHLALDLLSKPLTPDVASHLARGGFPWEAEELTTLTTPGLLGRDGLVHLVLDAEHLGEDDPAGGAACLEVLRRADAALVALVQQLSGAYRGLGPKDATRLVALLGEETTGVVETFLVLRASSDAPDEECLEAARRV